MAEHPFGQAFALFENNLASPASAILLEDCVQVLALHAGEDQAGFFSALDQARAAGAWLALAMDYEAGATLEPALQLRHTPNGQRIARAWVFRQHTPLQAEALERWWQKRLDTLTPQQREAGVLHLSPALDEAQHAAAARRVLELIHEGDCYQVNLTFPMHGRHYGHPLALFARLRDAQAVAHGALIHDGGDWILSRSPELFVERQGQRLDCRPMKGTALRHADPQADKAAADALLSSDKERAENLMIVDLIRNDLGRLAPPGGVRVTRLFELESYRSIHQLTSSVSAAPVDAAFRDVVQALFPCGSITGAPKIRAMQIIDELEDTPRGLYCGALGWLAPDGDFSLNVPIRTLLVDSGGACTLNVGSGVVADSDPAAEYRECLAKSRFIRQLDAELQLIETLRWDGNHFPLLAGHLARLHDSAATLGFTLPTGAAEDALRALKPRLGPLPRRVRMCLARNGILTSEILALAALEGEQQFALAPWQLDAADPRLAHKTTARRFYDVALKSAMAEGLFDLVFCNTRGELTEGARSNLFIERKGRLLTPAAGCGLLPGVLRAHLLQSGEAREAVLTPDDLDRAERIYLGNALRGLVEVTHRR